MHEKHRELVLAREGTLKVAPATFGGETKESELSSGTARYDGKRVELHLGAKGPIAR